MFGQIDHAHAAFAEFLAEGVFADDGAGTFGDGDELGAITRFGGKGGLGTGMGGQDVATIDNFL